MKQKLNKAWTYKQSNNVPLDEKLQFPNQLGSLIMHCERRMLRWSSWYVMFMILLFEFYKQLKQYRWYMLENCAAQLQWSPCQIETDGVSRMICHQVLIWLSQINIKLLVIKFGSCSDSRFGRIPMMFRTCGILGKVEFGQSRDSQELLYLLAMSAFALIIHQI